MDLAGGTAQSDEFDDADRAFMAMALELARKAEEADEVPVGAVLVQQGRVLGTGLNRPIEQCDPTSHAEIEALRAAAAMIGNYRLPGTTLFCSLEPCVMCAGAITIARVERLVFAARDLRFGAVRSKFALVDSPLLNHRVIVQEGLLAVEAGELMADFFRRSRKREKPSPSAGGFSLKAQP